MVPTQSTYIGVYLKHIMRNYRNGYTVFQLAVGNDIIICTGTIIPPKSQTKVEVTGKWVKTKYGLQLSECIIQEALTDPESLMEFLLSIPGIGSTIASQITDKVGSKLIDYVDLPNGVDLLANAGIPHSKAALIIEHLKKNQVKTKLFQFLTHFGAAYGSAEKIYAKYGVHSLIALSESPYQIGLAAGISFSICDSIAKTFGFQPTNEQRILAGVETILTRNAAIGNTYMPFCDAIKATKKLLGKSSPEEVISSIIIANSASKSGENIIYENDRLYLRYIYWQEKRVAYAIKRLSNSAISTQCNVDELRTYAEKACGVTYAEQQREIFNALPHGGVYVLTGGPGTGKTTVVKGFLLAYEKLYPKSKIKLCAPTGRASQRMKEATGREATTIHRLIEYKPYGNTAVCKNEANPIDADCIVIDESSMISIDVAELLFSAIRSGTMVLLVGDIDQLPSVGPGNVLGDIISSGCVPVVALTKTQRQGAGSPIIENARRIREGDPYLMSHELFKIIQTNDASIPKIVQELYRIYHDPTNPFKVQILTPSRKHAITGSTAISAKIQSCVCHSKKSIRYGNMSIGIGDKVMTTQNNYNIGYFNGDVGIVQFIGENTIQIAMSDSCIEIPYENLDDVILAYASTVHKSQGSEYETVIVVLPSEPLNMLQRNILYTAITRAKKRIIIVCAENTITSCVANIQTMQRKTVLAEYLTKYMYPGT